MNADDPAFPCAGILMDVRESDYVYIHGAHKGATLRAWFAGQALAHIPALIDASDENPSLHNIAEWAVQVADALIAELKKRTEAKE